MVVRKYDTPPLLWPDIGSSVLPHNGDYNCSLVDFCYWRLENILTGMVAESYVYHKNDWRLATGSLLLTSAYRIEVTFIM